MTLSGYLARIDKRIQYFAVGLIVLALAVMSFLGRIALDYMGKPVDITQVQLGAARSISALPHRLYHVVTQQSARIGTESVSEDNGPERTGAKFFAVPMGEKALVVRTGPSGTTTLREFTGEFEAIPEDVRTNIIEGQLDPDRLLPFQLNTETDGFDEAMTFGLLILLAATGLGLLAWINWRQASPLRNRSIKVLARYGQPLKIQNEIDRELATSKERRFIKPVEVGPRWLLFPHLFRVYVMRWDDVVWCHQLVTRHTTNGVRSGTTYTAVITDQSGYKLQISGKEAAIDELLELAIKRCPWAIHGYQEQIDRTMKGPGRAQFVAQVMARKASAA